MWCYWKYYFLSVCLCVRKLRVREESECRSDRSTLSQIAEAEAFHLTHKCEWKWISFWFLFLVSYLEIGAAVLGLVGPTPLHFLDWCSEIKTVSVFKVTEVFCFGAKRPEIDPKYFSLNKWAPKAIRSLIKGSICLKMVLGNMLIQKTVCTLSTEIFCLLFEVSLPINLEYGFNHNSICGILLQHIGCSTSSPRRMKLLTKRNDWDRNRNQNTGMKLRWAVKSKSYFPVNHRSLNI